MPVKKRIQLGRLSDAQLLDMRLCDLPVKRDRTLVDRCAKQLHRELSHRDIRHRPHVWLSSEWFSPDDVPGIAAPFYLAHPRLMKLEETMMLEVEGGRQSQCMKLMRHEAGHAICTAYRLHHRSRWRDVFGRFSAPYPASYQPQPYSHDFVVHLDRWYAQAHPAEDFAETFAVWLRNGSRWRRDYRGWPALRKLEYVDELMRSIVGKAAPVRSRRQVEPLRTCRQTLREHYRRKRRHYAKEWPEFFDREMRRVFSNDAKYAARDTAASFLRRLRPQVRNIVAEWTGVPPYTIDQVVRDMIDRCMELKLRLAMSRRDAKTHVMLMVAVQTMNYLHHGYPRIAL